MAECPQCGAASEQGCIAAPAHACFLELARPLFAEIERLKVELYERRTEARRTQPS